MKNMDEKAQSIAELRERFFKKLEDEGPPTTFFVGDFHSADIKRITYDNRWLERFLEHNDFNMEDALNMLWDTCEWRKYFGTNDIDETNVKKEYLESGVCFGYGNDLDGKILFVIKLKLYVRNSTDFKELRRCIVYWFERLEREGDGDQISIFFDMIDAGLSNLDTELTKFLIGLLKNFYPNFLNYIIVLEMPWVFNAAFSLIKTWLPSKGIPKIKFVKKSTLREFVDPKIALKSWGGKSDYTFVFTSEAEFVPLNKLEPENRKVQFTPCESGNPGYQSNVDDEMIIIEPDILTFSKNGNETVGIITLTNTLTDKNLAYKIKTTSPDKFKVRPSTAVLLASQKGTVTITLLPGYTPRGLLGNDRFLIMCCPTEEEKMTAVEAVMFWQTYESIAKQYRLVCRDKNFNKKSNHGGTDSFMNSLLSKICQLEERHTCLQNDITLLKYFLLISLTTIFTLLLWLIYFLETNFQNSVNEETYHTVINTAIPKHDEI